MTEPLSHPWLSLIGIGEGGFKDLTPAAKNIIENAQIIFGGARHRTLIDFPEIEFFEWESPLSNSLPIILNNKGKKVVILASGDPFYFGIGKLLAEMIPANEILSIPSPSSYSLAASYLKWSLQDCALLSLHGRSLNKIIPHLQPKAKILALSWDETTPSHIAALLRERGMGNTKIHILENLGGAAEGAHVTSANNFNISAISKLNLIALDIVTEKDSTIIPLSPGLPDMMFDHDGQITKREIRAITLSSLAPRQGDILWDIGAGSGSISIEWMRLNPKNHAFAIEKNKERAKAILKNAESMGAPELSVIIDTAPACFDQLPIPDAIFIGGGASQDVIDKAWNALPSGGRLVINAVTLETQALLILNYNHKGGDLITIDISRTKKIGKFHGLEPSMAIHQWLAIKP